MIHYVEINKFRGLEFKGELRKFNFIIGKDGSCKTSFLESIFLSTLFLSDMNSVDLSSFVNYTFLSRGNLISAFSHLTSSKSEVVIDNYKVTYVKEKESKISVKLNENTVATINLEFLPTIQAFIPYLTVEKVNEVKTDIGKSIYLTTYFDLYDNPERIISYAKREGFKTDFDILKGEYNQYILNYKGEPAYLIGRGFLKRELIKASLKFANLMLIDELENSLHPDLVLEVLKEIEKEGESKKDFQLIVSTDANEVLKLAMEIFPEEELLIYHFNSHNKYRKYTVDELKEFDFPLSWAGYV